MRNLMIEEERPVRWTKKPKPLPPTRKTNTRTIISVPLLQAIHLLSLPAAFSWITMIWRRCNSHQMNDKNSTHVLFLFFFESTSHISAASLWVNFKTKKKNWSCKKCQNIPPTNTVCIKITYLCFQRSTSILFFFFQTWKKQLESKRNELKCWRSDF